MTATETARLRAVAAELERQAVTMMTQAREMHVLIGDPVDQPGEYARGVIQERQLWETRLYELVLQAKGAAELVQTVSKAAQEEEFGDGYAKAVSEMVNALAKLGATT